MLEHCPKSVVPILIELALTDVQRTSVVGPKNLLQLVLAHKVELIEDVNFHGVNKNSTNTSLLCAFNVKLAPVYGNVPSKHMNTYSYNGC